MANSRTLKLTLLTDDKWSKGLKGARSRLGKFGSGLKTAVKGAGLFGAAVGVAGGAVFSMAQKVASAGDTVDKASRRMGVTTDTYQELAYWADQNGVAQQDLEKSVGRLTQRAGEAVAGNKRYADSFADLGVKLQTANGDMRSTDELLPEIVSKLNAMESPAQRMAAATDILGTRMARQLQPALDKGALSLEDATNKARDLGLVMSEDAVASSVKFTDSLATLKETGAGLFRQALTPIVSVLADRVFPAVQKVIGVFREDGLAGVFDLVRTKITEALPAIQTKLGQLGERFVAWVQDAGPPLLAKLGELLASLGQWIIGTALPALGAKLVEWGQAFIEWVGPQIPPLLRELGSLIASVQTWVLETGLPMLVRQLREWAESFVAWVGPAIPPMLLELGKLLLELGRWVVIDALPTLTKKLLEWAGAFAGWVLTEALPSLITNTNKLRRRLLTWIVSEALPAIVSKLGEWALAFVGWVGDALLWLPRKLDAFRQMLVGWVRRMPAKIASAAVGMWDGIGDAFRSALNWIIRLWNRLEFQLPSFGGLSVAGKQVIPGFTGPTLGTPNIPMLAQGGIAVGPTPAIIGEAGPEAVVPLDKLAQMLPGRGGPNITVNVTGTMLDPEGVARAVERALRDSHRRHGGVVAA